jgi:hypothetical protein
MAKAKYNLMNNFRILSSVILTFLAWQIHAQQTIISIPKQNFCFLDISNEIQVLIENKFCNELYIKTNNGIISKNETPCSFNYLPSLPVKTEIYVCEIQNQDTIIVDTQIIWVKPIASQCIELYIAGKGNGDTVNIVFISATPKIFASLSCFDISFEFTVIDFYIEMIMQEGRLIEKIYNKGPVLDELIVKSINMLLPGDRIRFSDVRVKGASNYIYELEPIELIIE